MATELPPCEATFTLEEVLRATGGELHHGEPSRRLQGVATDTRRLRPGELFVALKGERFDANAFLPRAVEAGASALVAHPGAAVDALPVPVVTVPDTLRALGDLARAWQRRLRAARPIPVVAISGAVGKTTTKELTRAALEAIFGACHGTVGNLNNLVGAPWTVLGLTAEHRALVVECGSNAPGEIARLGDIIEPEVALCTNADAAHTEFLGSVDAVAEEEGSLFAHARRAVCACVDEPRSYARSDLRRPGVAKIPFGIAPLAGVRALRRTPLADGRQAVELSLPNGEGLLVTTGLLGPVVATNLAAALAAAWACGADLEGMRRAAEALGAVPSVPGRLCLREGPRWAVVDDTYNASPRAVAAALDAAAELCRARRGRLVVALGDMLELGALAATAHDEAVTGARAAGAAVLLCVGAQAVAASERVPLPGVELLRAAGSDEGAGLLRGRVRDGDVVLVKGSRGVRMERCVDALLEAER
ncbi:MAG: UDP-N-acetylmuramoyl-tripeptide--D-alanyl-D-alanine ligase [Deltaproteobacteria bacterium]|nr:UDP-N-acetylmuramoyl-tripeptide--D-alanyl-D-alanine ligase [Deltaproteobacteria bacterium]